MRTNIASMQKQCGHNARRFWPLNGIFPVCGDREFRSAKQNMHKKLHTNSDNAKTIDSFGSVEYSIFRLERITLICARTIPFNWHRQPTTNLHCFIVTRCEKWLRRGRRRREEVRFWPLGRLRYYHIFPGRKRLCEHAHTISMLFRP